MFEQQITEYLQPYGMKPAVQEEIVAAVGSRLTQQPCRPDPALAGNLLLQYGWAGEPQKQRYTALLAAAMQDGSTVHPAFPSLVSQMDETDLTLLDAIGKQGRMPVLDCYLSRMKKSSGFTGKPSEDVATSIELVTRMTDFLPADGDYERIQAAIDNLLRLHPPVLCLRPVTVACVASLFGKDLVVASFCSYFFAAPPFGAAAVFDLTPTLRADSFRHRRDQTNLEGHVYGQHHCAV